MALPGWFSTAIRPFEFTATPSTSPRFMSGEYLRKSAATSNGISGALTTAAGAAGAACCARTDRWSEDINTATMNVLTKAAIRSRFTHHLPL